MEKDLKNENEALEEAVEITAQIEQPEEAETITANTSEDLTPEKKPRRTSNCRGNSSRFRF